MEITNWSQLTLEEKNLVIMELASIFSTLGATAATAETWYNSGFVRLDRRQDKSIILGLDHNKEYIELATKLHGTLSS